MTIHTTCTDCMTTQPYDADDHRPRCGVCGAHLIDSDAWAEEDELMDCERSEIFFENCL